MIKAIATGADLVGLGRYEAALPRMLELLDDECSAASIPKTRLTQQLGANDLSEESVVSH